MFLPLLASIETTVLLSVAAFYIVHCPFNKVEESFNTQAVHDIINLFPTFKVATNVTTTTGFEEIAERELQSWDHTIFPGVVPRTFVGAFSVGLPLKLFRNALETYVKSVAEEGHDPDLTTQFLTQLAARFVLAVFVMLSLCLVTRALQKKHGTTFRLCFLITTLSQFHYIFYASRFLPNTFAAILANIVFACWIDRKYSGAVVFIAACVVIFRFDTSIFFGWLLIDAVFIKRQLALSRVFKVGIPAGIYALALTVGIDSYFWGRLVWPELSGLYFNVWLNKSHEYGTQPFMWYIYSCMPRLLMASFPFLILAEHKVTRDYLLPVLAFIYSYSLLAHKELRFILFVLPLINIGITSGQMTVKYYIDKFCKRRTRIARLIFVTMIGVMFLSNIFASYIWLRVSSHNYPGGHAALHLGVTKEILDNVRSVPDINTLKDPRSDVGVYVNNLAAQTGMSRFLQVDGAYYAKTPQLDESSFKKQYKLLYMLLEPKEVPDFIRHYCPGDRNQRELLEQSADVWKKNRNELRCSPPNQAEMYCSIVDNVGSFRSVNIGGLMNHLKQTRSISEFYDIITNDANFIRTRIALHILRCGTRSRANPFG